MTSSSTSPSTSTFRRGYFDRLLFHYACFCAGSILFLICLGGVVTSERAGMSVPDYPNSYGYNMFLFPWDQWVGGIFWEHSHRLVATGVGLLIIGLTILFLLQSRSYLRVMGWVALVLVCLQGAIGGARVLLKLDWLGIPHALLSQAFFAEVALMALFASRWWMNPATAVGSRIPRNFFYAPLIITVLIFLQLGLGATMRHQHTDLAVTDFPTAYGQPWPRVDPASVKLYNKERLAKGEEPTTAVQIHLQMTHRVMAVLILLGIFGTMIWLVRTASFPWALLQTALVWCGLVMVQFTLGMYVIWTNKAADVATAHVGTGALTFVTGVLLSAQAWRLQVARVPAAPARSPSPEVERMEPLTA